MPAFNAFLISGRAERFPLAAQELESVDIQFHIIPAVYPADKGTFETAALRGCFESHLLCLKTARAFPEHALIMEDDIFFRHDFSDRFPDYLSRIGYLNEWDMVNFYGSSFPELDLNHLYNFSSFCSHFYLVNRLSLEKVISLVENKNEVIDQIYYRAFSAAKLSVWCTAQQLVMQNIDFESDLDTTGINYAKEGSASGIYRSRTLYRKEHCL